jgi:hypothetical protein
VSERRNAPLPAPQTPNLPLGVKRWLGFMLRGGTMGLAGLLAFWRHRPSFKRFSFAANLALVYAGVYLLFTQLHAYQHDVHPDDFRFPAQEHKHIHEDMDIDKLVDPQRDTL